MNRQGAFYSPAVAKKTAKNRATGERRVAAAIQVMRRRERSTAENGNCERVYRRGRRQRLAPAKNLGNNRPLRASCLCGSPAVSVGLVTLWTLCFCRKDGYTVNKLLGALVVLLALCVGFTST